MAQWWIRSEGDGVEIVVRGGGVTWTKGEDKKGLQKKGWRGGKDVKDRDNKKRLGRKRGKL